MRKKIYLPLLLVLGLLTFMYAQDTKFRPESQSFNLQYENGLILGNRIDNNPSLYIYGGNGSGTFKYLRMYVTTGGVPTITSDATSISAAIKLTNPDGTVSLPGIAFTGDTDTGLYRIGANNVGIAANGTKILDITSTDINASMPIDFSGMTPSGTAGSLITTGSTWVAFPTANACGIKVLLSNTSSTGEFASMRIRGRSDSVTPTVAGNFSASAGINDHGDLYAVQGYAQPNAYTSAVARYVVGLYSCIDRTAGSSSVGYDWSTWIDTHMAVKASGSSYLLRLSHNGTVANDGAITIYNGGRMPYFINFEDATGGGFLTDTGDAGSTKAGYLAVKTPAGVKYIQLVTT